MSAVSATGYDRKRSRTSTKGGCNVGPTRRVSLSDTPVEDLADPSKTARILVVVHARGFVHSVHWEVECVL